MTQPKTIPNDPKPVVGERMAVYDKRFEAWDVYQWHDGPGGPFRLHVAIHLSEKDARRLVFGRRVEAVLQDVEELFEDTSLHDSPLRAVIHSVLSGLKVKT